MKKIIFLLFLSVAVNAQTKYLSKIGNQSPRWRFLPNAVVITPSIQDVALVGNNLENLPLNFKSGSNESTINGERIFFYHPLGNSQFNGGALQIYSNTGKYILLNPDVGLLLKTKGDGLNGGSELVLKSDNLTGTRFQQATDANGIVPVMKYVEVIPNNNDIGKMGEIRIKDNAVYFYTELGWKSITLN